MVSMGGSVARGTGYLTCGGSGCQGTHPQKMAIKLSRPRRCPDRVRIYSRFDTWFYAPHSNRLIKHSGYRILCNGMAGGGGG